MRNASCRRCSKDDEALAAIVLLVVLLYSPCFLLIASRGTKERKSLGPQRLAALYEKYFQARSFILCIRVGFSLAYPL